MALALLSFVAALWGGLVRLGWDWHPVLNDLPLAHGPLMVGGFLGTLIGLERAAALNRPWCYAAPLLSSLGALASIADFSHPAGPLLMTLSSLGLVAVSCEIVRRQRALFTVTLGLGSLAWLAGNVLWLSNWQVHRLALLWAGFPVLTICGERLELSRLLSLSRRSRGAFLLAAGLFAAGLLASAPSPDRGVQWAGAGMVALALWLFRYDVARRTIKQRGLTRHVAACLLSGYVWLGVAGVIATAWGGVPLGPRYDALLHALFLGFVFSMIFGHAPIVLPAALGKSVPYRRGFYLHLGALHASLLLRIGGDLAEWPAASLWGGLLNAAAILLFLGNVGRAVRSRPQEGPASGHAPSRSGSR